MTPDKQKTAALTTENRLEQALLEEAGMNQAAEEYLSHFEIIDGKIINKWHECEIDLDSIRAAYHRGFEFARNSTEPLSILEYGLDYVENEHLSNEFVWMNKEKSVPLSPDKYMVCIFEERIEQRPHIHVIIPGELDIAYCIRRNQILGIMEGDEADLKSLTKEVVAWFELPCKEFGTNRDACLFQFNIQTYAENSLLTPTTHENSKTWNEH
jgi:hypothetical protein